METKNLSDYLDRWGLVCVSSLDGGDTLANTFTIAYCQGRCRPTDLDLLYNKDAKIWVRHPDRTKWYSQPDRTSRDQITPLLIYLAAYGPEWAWQRLVKSHKQKWFSWAWNTRRNFVYSTLEEHLARSTPDVAWDYAPKTPDFCGPDIWAVYARGWARRSWAGWAARPVVWLGDLQLVAGAALKLYKWKFRRHLGTGRSGIDHDDRNFALKVHFARHYMPSLLSRLAWAVYGSERPLACFQSFWGAQAAEPPVDQFMKQLWRKKN